MHKLTKYIVHTDSFKEIHGTLRAQRDWTRYVKPIQNYKGGLGNPYSFVRVTVPECRPDRLEIIAYANEYAFLYDGKDTMLTMSIVPADMLIIDEMENLNLQGTLDLNARAILETFQTDIMNRDVSSKSSPEKRIQAQILTEMLAIDPERAETTMKAWATFIQLAVKTRSKPLETLAEYVLARVIDAGEL